MKLCLSTDMDSRDTSSSIRSLRRERKKFVLMDTAFGRDS